MHLREVIVVPEECQYIIHGKVINQYLEENRTVFYLLAFHQDELHHIKKAMCYANIIKRHAYLIEEILP